MNLKMEHKAIEAVARVLKEAGVRFEKQKRSFERHGVDAEFRLLASGETLLMTYHPGIAPLQLKWLLTRLREETGPKRHAGVCVRRITWSLLDACKEAHVALFDLEGNAYLRLPGVYIERIRPSRKNGPEPVSGTVFTAKAARLVRAFLHRYPHDWVQADLVRKTGLSAGYVSTLVKRLVGQGYASDRLGLLYLDDPERMLNDWVAHYRFDRHQRLSYAISASSYEDGIKKLANELKASAGQFAWTGWTGAHLRAPYATPSQYMAYVAAAPKQMKGVFPVKKEGNVTLYVPQDEGVFQFTTPSKAGEIVSDAQLYVDLCRMPGRAKEQADALRLHRLEFSRMTN